MTDRIDVVSCRGGLNERASDIDVSGGEVRRSSNYEQAAEGGYRRIGGSSRWGQARNLPDLEMVVVVETEKRYAILAGQQITFEVFASPIVSINTSAEYLLIAAIGRDDSNLMLFEKFKPTDYLDSGDLLDFGPGGLSQTPRVLIENPVLTDSEQKQVLDIVSTFALNQGDELIGNGDVVCIQCTKRYTFAVRYENDDLVYQNHRKGVGWTLSGTLTPSERPTQWSSCSYQFSGRPEAAFIANGQTKAVRIEEKTLFSDVVIEEIAVPSVTAFPQHCIVHENHLFLSFEGGRVIHSDLGDPMTFSNIGGAAEFAIGDEVTGFQILPGESLAIFTEGGISILQGTSVADWRLLVHSDQVGVVPGTIQNMPTTIFASSRGITTLPASDNYGDFNANMISHRFDKTFQKIQRGTKLFSLVNREKSQYRLINENGYGLFLTFANQTLVGAMEVDLKHKVTAVGFREGDPDELYFAAEGWIHIMDVGTTMSGRDIDAFIEFPFNHYGSPRQKKRFKQIVLDMKGDEQVELEISTMLDKSRPFHSDSIPVDVTVDKREEQRYNSEQLSRFDSTFQGIAYTVGTGFDQSLLIRARNAGDHEIDSITTHYTVRGQQR